MKTLSRLLLVFHCLLALSMPAHAMAGLFTSLSESRSQLASAEHCHENSAQPASSGTQAEEHQQSPHSGHAACTDCLMCSSGCLPADLSGLTLSAPVLSTPLVSRLAVLEISPAPAPELKPPRA